jgi:hypothetical protein
MIFAVLKKSLDSNSLIVFFLIKKFRRVGSKWFAIVRKSLKDQTILTKVFICHSTNEVSLAMELEFMFNWAEFLSTGQTYVDSLLDYWISKIVNNLSKVLNWVNNYFGLWKFFFI